MADKLIGGLNDALEYLGIPEFKKRICNMCHSEDRLVPLCFDYMAIAEICKKNDSLRKFFRSWFLTGYETMTTDGLEDRFLLECLPSFEDFIKFIKEFDKRGGNELLEAIKSNIDATDSLEQRTVGTDDVDGLVVSTINTTDMGLETAIKDKNGWNPVERYENEVDAKIGHYQWVKRIVGMAKITRLGYGPLEAKEIELDRYV